MRFESQYNTSEVEDVKKDAQVTCSSQRGRCGERDVQPVRWPSVERTVEPAVMRLCCIESSCCFSDQCR